MSLPLRKNVLLDPVAFVLKRLNERRDRFPDARFAKLNPAEYELLNVGPHIGFGGPVDCPEREALLKAKPGATVPGEVTVVWEPSHIGFLLVQIAQNYQRTNALGPLPSYAVNDEISKQRFVDWYNQTQQAILTVDDFDFNTPMIIKGDGLHWVVNLAARDTSVRFAKSGVFDLPIPRMSTTLKTGTASMGGFAYYGIANTLPGLSDWKGSIIADRVSERVFIAAPVRGYQRPTPKVVMCAVQADGLTLRFGLKDALEDDIPWRVKFKGKWFIQINSNAKPVAIAGSMFYKDYVAFDEVEIVVPAIDEIVAIEIDERPWSWFPPI